MAAGPRPARPCALLLVSCLGGLPGAAALKASLRAQSRTAVFGTGRWDLDRIFKDDPPGAYLDLLEPVAYAAYLPYRTTEGERYDADGVWDDKVWGSKYHANATATGLLSGGGRWERLYEVEQAPEAGTFMRAIVDHGAKRAILGFRGTCLDKKFKSCKNDLCAAALARFGAKFDMCALMGKGLRGYIDMAAEDVRRTRERLGPGYAIMLTGHSLGGLIALTVDALHKLDTQTVALEATPYGKVMTNLLHLSTEEIAALDASRRYAVYDPHDLLSTTYGPLEELRPSTTVCVYEGQPLTSACEECLAETAGQSGEVSLAQGAGAAAREGLLRQCMGSRALSLEKAYTKCKDSVHFLDHYAADLFPRKNPDGSTYVPSCKVVGVAQPAQSS